MWDGGDLLPDLSSRGDLAPGFDERDDIAADRP